MAKYRKKPVVIEAIQWTGENAIDIYNFMESSDAYIGKQDGYMLINTLEGVMKASTGDFIIKGVHGEFYPCKPDIFEKTYEPAEE